MSYEAMGLAMRLDIRPSGTKFVLVALANCADDKGLCWPSIDHLAQATAQDRKSVMAALKRLEVDDWLADTGERRGRTRQVKVLRLNLAKMADPPMFHVSPKGAESGTVSTDAKGTESGTLPFPNGTESGTVTPSNSAESGTLPASGEADNGTESGTLAASNGTESGTVEGGNSTVFSGKGSQKRYTEPVIEPKAGGSASAGAHVHTREAQLAALSPFDRDVIHPYLADGRLPPSIDLALFAGFVKHRNVAHRPLSIASFGQFLADCRLFASEGHDLNACLSNTVALGLLRLVRPPSRAGPRPPRPRMNDDFSRATFEATPNDELPAELRNAG